MPSPFDRLNNIKNRSNSTRSTHVAPNLNNNQRNSQPVMNNYKKVGESTLRRGYDPSRIPTGIRGFDQMIQGGFKKGSVNLLSGGPGTGKTVFAIEFVINGIMLFNEPGIYISFDERKESVFENVKSMGWDLKRLEEEEKFQFVEYTPEQLMKILNEGGGLLDNLMSKSKAKRLVIDSISTFLLLSSSEFGKREQLTGFFKLLKKWGVTTILTNEYTPVTGNEISKETLSTLFETDSITQMYYTHPDIGSERKRFIEIYKMRGTKHLTKAVLYQIDEKGIDIIDSLN